MNAKTKATIGSMAFLLKKRKRSFFDENAMEFFDPDHSEDEDRFLMLGLSYRLRILVVCHCLRQSDSEIRIISARKATKREQKVYTGAGQ